MSRDVGVITFDLKNSLTLHALHQGFEAIVSRYSIDTIVLIDAGDRRWRSDLLL